MGTHKFPFTHRLTLPSGEKIPLAEVRFFNQQPPLVLAGNAFISCAMRRRDAVIAHWVDKPAVPVRRLSHRLLVHLRQAGANKEDESERLCVVHPAGPQLVFELLEDTVRLRLLAKSFRDGSVWFWTGQDWRPEETRKRPTDKPEILDDPRPNGHAMVAPTRLVHTRVGLVDRRRE